MSGAVAPRRRRARRARLLAPPVALRAALLVTLLAALPAACATGPGPTTPSGGDGLTVFAAASLHGVFTELAPAFEEEHGVEVAFSFAGSSDLVAQVDAGAPADVLATADRRTMADAEELGLLSAAPAAFASNHLVLVTPPDDPGGVTGLDASLEHAALVVCAPQVPCGAAAATLAERVGVTLAPVSEEPSATAVLGTVTSGQADAGLVYASDARGAGAAVRTLEVPGADEVRTTYSAAVVAGAADPATAASWVHWLRTPPAREALERAGFGAP
ncbi:molybdate ABC transporter substrate-binding protein [Georgenia faecalis]|uniref:Molybdate ABC transporter substrate-binding protein n=1 Tax=Georgenia faecalis TaxID=2483799 RepID=A0ABV9D7G2_9MICO|nr:molybdate ABC transporter substrate-binding protein [Georgenia faecalis]